MKSQESRSENIEKEPLSFIDMVQGVNSYEELYDLLGKDGKKRGYHGKEVIGGIKEAIVFKSKTEQSSLNHMDMTAYEQLTAELSHMDNDEADAVIEKVGWLIENEPQQTKDATERKEMEKKIKQLKAMQKREEEEEVYKLKEEIESQEEPEEVKSPTREEWALPPKEVPTKKWYEFWK